MNTNYQEHIPEDFNNASRIWIYQSNRLFSMAEAFEIEDLLTEFLQSWKSHGDPVKGYANLFFGQFIILMADESATTVGGCSADSSVHLIRAIENKFQVDLLNRQNMAFIVKDKIELLPLNQLAYAFENRFIDGDTLYFNNTVLTKKDLLEKWLLPVKESWLANRIKIPTAQ